MHKPVLLNEVLDTLKVRLGGRYIDATFGAGGHARAILEKGGRVLAIEADPVIFSIAKPSDALLVHGNFRNITKIASENGFLSPDGILMDLGISSIHLDGDKRGFSFKNPEDPLDMRLDSEAQAVTAADLLNTLSESQLAGMFESKSLARKVIRFRDNKKFVKSGDLLSLFENKKRGKIHPATKAFMSLRIVVNSEFENIREALPEAYGLLGEGGRLAVITFHSGEDRIVKNFFKGKNGQMIVPTEEEIARNPRARSAKLRFVVKK